jgi:hypothetical protein
MPHPFAEVAQPNDIARRNFISVSELTDLKHPKPVTELSALVALFRLPVTRRACASALMVRPSTSEGSEFILNV